MIEQLKETTEKILGFRISGKLHDEDYKHFVPIVEAAIKTQGKVRLLARFEDFHGWDLHALWDDTKFAHPALCRRGADRARRRQTVGKVDGASLQTIHARQAQVLRGWRYRVRLAMAERSGLSQKSNLRMCWR